MDGTAPTRPTTGTLDRRTFVARAAAATAFAGVALDRLAGAAQAAPAAELEEVTIAELRAALAAGRETAVSLVNKYLARIQALDRNGPKLNSIIEVNPDALRIAGELDRERRAGRLRGPLHGIPIVLKDNIDTADRMQTSAGSLALVGAPPAQDATVARKLREAGAVILGKANLSEWANFRGFFSSSGWSGRAGQCRNPYVLDRNPCGSSSGSGIAPSANLCAAAIGTETDGSIVCPSNANGIVGIKPTVGLTSRAGVVPISHSQDTVGPHGRTVADAAAVLGAIASVTPDPRDPATATSPTGGPRSVFSDYTQFLDPTGLRGARIGVPRAGVFDFTTEEVDRAFEEALDAMRDAGATIVDPADIPTIGQINTFFEELVVLVFEFKRDLNAYLATRSNVALDREGFPRTLAGLIAFNEAHAEQELKWFGQQWFELAEAEIFDQATYDAAAPEARRIGGPDGIDAVLREHNLHALVSPTDSPAWPIDLVNGDHFIFGTSSPAAIAGYPIINVPMGFAFGLPLGISFYGTAFSEPTLIRLASGFEAATRARRPPGLLETLPLENPLRRGRKRAPGLPSALVTAPRRL
ncbi:MAG TPA: amidase [Gaiellaceae bacterium]|nr:amidase [Gaiellaceae bacterium]